MIFILNWNGLHFLLLKNVQIIILTKSVLHQKLRNPKVYIGYKLKTIC